MTKQEFANIAAAMKAYYPRDNFLPDTISMTAWYEALQDIDYNVAKNAVQAHVQLSPYPPTVADIRKNSVKITTPEVMGDWSDGWGQVKRAISRYGSWDMAGALSSFDDTTREAVKRLGWDDICSSENIETTRAQFRQTYELISKWETEQACIPAKIKAQLGELKLLGGKA